MNDFDIDDLVRVDDKIRVSTKDGSWKVAVVEEVENTSKYQDRVKIKLESEDTFRYIKSVDLPEKIVLREEDVRHSVINDLRYKETMLQSQICTLLEKERDHNMRLPFVAKNELRKTLNAVRLRLKSHGARTSNWVDTDG